MNYETILPKYTKTLQQTSLFGSIDPASYPELLEGLNARTRRVRKDEVLLNMGDPFRTAGLVLEGTLEVSFENENFDQINMNYFRKGALFGESLVLNRIENSPVQLRAVEDCLVLTLDLAAVYDAERWNTPAKRQFSANIIRTLARRNVFLNLKIRIHTQKSIRDKVLIYLNSLPEDENGWKQIPFSQTALAEFLGVNRSALAREISKMKADGLLEGERRRYRVL